MREGGWMPGGKHIVFRHIKRCLCACTHIPPHPQTYTREQINAHVHTRRRQRGRGEREGGFECNRVDTCGWEETGGCSGRGRGGADPTEAYGAVTEVLEERERGQRRERERERER